ncbi:hypothetical protein MGA5115_02038 [Marinomonas gallaica]|uniref:HTH tetR-type domain-containing protein n=1 Tax=Marinomonas gallaica TaxID=1806667 RepID=A0A1C3JRQ8_9GAMM|nr:MULTISPECIES: TetR/AcrR family transcriptional regulator [Marinomonas]SBT17921.1 hypothetical protein MGA5115_02038 [Marinomonas gallaica]SBT20779.1 hypothetical protein MGA5116_01366 [Marinomonas gallaica]
MSTMNKTQQKIAAALEHAFAENGFTEIGVDGLRDATQVSLRTLYKYCPSREEMIITALDYRHMRYMTHLFDDLPLNSEQALDEIWGRVGTWMLENAANGCLFHGACASHPNSLAIRTMLERHKMEVINKMVLITGLVSARDQLMLLHEGITQSWPLMHESAVKTATTFSRALFS